MELAAAGGVTLGFETMETEFMNTVGKAMEHVKRVDSPYLGVYPDIGNITNAAKTYGTDVLADLECGHGHLVAMHPEGDGAGSIPGGALRSGPCGLPRSH